MSAIDMPGVAVQETPSGMATATLLTHVPRKNMNIANKASKGEWWRIVCMSVSADLGQHVEACRVVIAGSVVASQLPYGYNNHKMTLFGARKAS